MLPKARLGLLMAGPVVALVGLFMVGFPGLVIGLMVGVGLYVWSSRWGCTLESDAIVIEAVVTRRIPWPDVQAISYQISRLSTAATIVDKRGKVWMLRAPAHSSFAPDPLLRTKMTEIENFWKAHRGSEWHAMSSIASGLQPWQRTE